MMDQEQQQITAMMHVQVVQDGVDALFVGSDLLIHRAEKVEEMPFAAARIALRPAVSRGLPQGPRDIAFSSPPIIDRLFGSLGWPGLHVDGLLTRIAFGRHRSPLINV